MFTAAQRGVTTFGMQVKPVIPLSYFDPITLLEEGALKGRMELTGGYAFGMSVRTGMTRTLSFETGINQIRRHYRFELANDTTAFSDGDRIRFVGYEIPLLLLVYIRLGEYTWMNAAMGPSIDMYPSDAIRGLLDMRAYVARQGWISPGAVANLGFEYRTERSGIIYLGATYHRAFGDMAQVELTWFDPNGRPFAVRRPLAGSYLTVDLRYYFHEDPEKRRSRRKQEEPW